MNSYKKIEHKVHLFVQKYYTNELIKGVIFFLSIGALYFFFTIFIEYFLWLKPEVRVFLFWVLILIEFLLLTRFILFPIFKLIGLKKGISYEESSKIIGNHFPEVGDKLLNVLQLKNENSQTDLLLASIEQKSKELSPIPFTKAINFSTNVKHLRYAFVPVLIYVFILFLGKSNEISDSLKRVVDYKTAYLPPAPFGFFIDAEKLTVIQGKSITINVVTRGKILPESSKIFYNNQQYFLQNTGSGKFSYTFTDVNFPIDFYISSNGISSKNYKIHVIKTPTIQQLEMVLEYPNYIKKRKETISNTGNLTVPLGTRVTWKINTHQTDSVAFNEENTKKYFIKNTNDNFSFSKRILKQTEYQISTSNTKLKDYESLNYSISVVKDENPLISVRSNIDSVSRGNAQFFGQISDDYGFKKLQLVYYDEEHPDHQLKFDLPISKSTIQTFYYQFPDGLNLKKGVNYELFFQVFDNDGVNGSKKAISKKFNYRKKTNEEIDQELLNEQKNYIYNLEKSLQKQQRSKLELEKIQEDLQRKKNVNWNDKKKIQNFIKRQEQYKQMMENQTKKIQENFLEKKEESESLQEKKENLQKRIEELKKLKKQQKLLDELQEMAKKLNKENLLKKAKELSEQSKQQERSLERILELTKRFYVEQKATQLSNKLDKLSKTQSELEKKQTSEKEQKEIKKEFDAIQKELNELQKDNQKLKEPMEIPKLDNLQKETKQELNKAEQNLNQQKSSDAKKNQKKASKKMKEMSMKMQQSMDSMNSGMKEENMEAMRQILENLVVFSFKQETLMDGFSNSNANHPNFGKNLRKQHQLKKYFEHIDDSLYVLSLRVPQISTKIQDQLSSAHYNLDQSLANFAETRFSGGISNQRYVMTAANSLADMLSNVLDNMKNAPKSMSGKGKGGKSFSLPDIIQKQKGLQKKMENGMQKKGEKGKSKDGKSGKPNQKGKEGKQQKGGEGSEGLDGELYQIYKEQSLLRQELQNAIKQGKGNSGATKRVLKSMEQLENEILEKGFTQGIIQRMRNLNYQLLKLDKATFKQGEDKKRKSNTNITTYEQQKIQELQLKKLFYNQTEILNRQSLPLQQNYKKKVQEYFSTTKKKN